MLKPSISDFFEMLGITVMILALFVVFSFVIVIL